MRDLGIPVSGVDRASAMKIARSPSQVGASSPRVIGLTSCGLAEAAASGFAKKHNLVSPEHKLCQ